MNQQPNSRRVGYASAIQQGQRAQNQRQQQAAQQQQAAAQQQRATRPPMAQHNRMQMGGRGMNPVQPHQNMHGQQMRGHPGPMRGRGPMQRMGRNPNQRPPQPQWSLENVRGPGEEFAKVRRAISGDTLDIQKRNAPDTEEVSLAGVRAPMISFSKNRATEEAFAWEAREFLRKTLINKIVRVRVVKNEVSAGNQQGRKRTYVHIFFPLDSRITKDTVWKDATVHMLENGWVQTSRAKSSPISQELKDEYNKLQAQASDKKLGTWLKPTGNMSSSDFLNAHIRSVDWSENNKTLFDKYGGKKAVRIRAIVDQVRDGTTVRAELLLENLRSTMVWINMTGVVAERYPKPLAVLLKENENRDKKLSVEEVKKSVKQASPICLDAKRCTRDRLLGMDVEVVLDYCNDRGELWGSIFMPGSDGRKDIAAYLINHGLAKCVEWTARLVKGKQAYYMNCQEQAIKRKVGMWKNTVASPQRKVDKQSWRVSKVDSGDKITITRKNNQLNKKETKQVFLASVRSPKMGRFNEKDPKRMMEEYAFEAKEYLRTKLIGKDINVKVEYTKNLKRGDAEVPVEFVTVTHGKININLDLVSQGWAECTRFSKKDTTDQPDYYVELQREQEKAREKNLGKWAKETYKKLKIRDLSTNRQTMQNERAGRYDASFTMGIKKFLQTSLRLDDPDKPNFRPRCSRQVGIVEHVMTGSRLKVRLHKMSDESHQTIVSLNLSGLKADNPTRTGEKRPDSYTPWGDEALEYTNSKYLQREVRVYLETVDRNCRNFIGQISSMSSKELLGEQLLRQGYCTLMKYSAKNSCFKEKLEAAVLVGKQSQKGRWFDWTEEKEKAEEMERQQTFQNQRNQRIEEAEDEKQKEEEEPTKEPVVVEFQIRHVSNGAEFCALDTSRPDVKKHERAISEYMKSVEPKQNFLAPEEKSRNKIVAGMFNGEYFRCKLIKRIEWEDSSAKPRIPLKGGPVWKVEFIDWGNECHLPDRAECLCKINDPISYLDQNGMRRKLNITDLKEVPPLVSNYKLAGLSAPPVHLHHAYENAGKFLGSYCYKKVGAEHSPQSRVARGKKLNEVVLYSDVEKSRNINEEMVSKGFARVDKRSGVFLKNKELLKRFEKLEEPAFKRRAVGTMWQYGDPGSDDEDEEKPRGRRR